MVPNKDNYLNWYAHEVDLWCVLDAKGVELHLHQLPDKFRVTIGAVQVRPFLQAFVENGFSLF